MLPFGFVYSPQKGAELYMLREEQWKFCHVKETSPDIYVALIRGAHCFLLWFVFLFL